MIRLSNNAAKRTLALNLRTVLGREFCGTHSRLTSIPPQPIHVSSNRNTESPEAQNSVSIKENGSLATPQVQAASRAPDQVCPSSSGPANLEEFQAQLSAKLALYPDYSLKSIYKAIRKLPERNPRAWEIAFDMLIRHKRFQDAANILNNFLKQGFLAKDATQAKMMSFALAKTLPDDITMEETVAHLCVIVEEPSFTEKKLHDLLKVLKGLEVDRYIVALLVNKFREGRGPDYVPKLHLIPDFAEALIRNGDVDDALKMLENLPSSSDDVSHKSISLTFTSILVAFRDMYEWNSDLVDRIVRAVEQHGVDLQIPVSLLLSWAVRQKKYKSVLELYNITKSVLVMDAYVYSALFEMHLTFESTRLPAKFQPLAFRRLFRNMYLGSLPAAANASPVVVPDTALLNTALTASVRMRDYAAALVILRMYALSPAARLDPASFYAVIQPLIRRMHGDLTSKRRMRIRETKWADYFLGATFGSVAFSEGLVTRTLEQVRRSSFDVNDPLYAPTAAEAIEASLHSAHRRSMSGPSTGLDLEPYCGVTMEELVSRCGPLQYKMPSMQTMEMVNPQLAGEPDVDYDVVPLERLLRRAIFAEIMNNTKRDPNYAMRMVEEAIRTAEEEMMPSEREEKYNSDDGQ